jgi:hypothetical protein
MGEWPLPTQVVFVTVARFHTASTHGRPKCVVAAELKNSGNFVHAKLVHSFRDAARDRRESIGQSACITAKM